MALSRSRTFVAGDKTVPTAGTAVALSAPERVKAVTIVAKEGNAGRVYVGGADVSSATNGGLGPGDSLLLEAVGWLDLAEVYVDADVSGDGVDFYAVRA